MSSGIVNDFIAVSDGLVRSGSEFLGAPTSPWVLNHTSSWHTLGKEGFSRSREPCSLISFHFPAYTAIRHMFLVPLRLSLLLPGLAGNHRNVTADLRLRNPKVRKPKVCLNRDYCLVPHCYTN